MAWKLPTLARVANGWSLNTDTMGVYGNYYLKRAIVTQLGLGANLAGGRHLSSQPGRRNRQAARWGEQIHDALSRRAPLRLSTRSGRSRFMIRKDFRSETVLNRFAVSSWMPFKYNADGSLDLYFQNESPGKDREAELASCAERAVQSDDAPLRPEIGGSHRQVDSAAGRKNSEVCRA